MQVRELSVIRTVKIDLSSGRSLTTRGFLAGWNLPRIGVNNTRAELEHVHRRLRVCAKLELLNLDVDQSAKRGDLDLTHLLPVSLTASLEEEHVCDDG